jgi:Tfp pilus assembly protein FimT
MKRFAFTMLELAFVIIVIGILAVLAMPSFNSNPLQKAAEQVAGHIRYTQHLAMVDDKYDPSDATWFREKWQIRFRRNSGESGYVIFSDYVNTQRNADNAEMAIDPLTGQRINGFDLYPAANLTTSYDVKGDNTGIVQSCFTADGSLVTSNRGVFSFDHYGRPYSGVSNATSPTQYLMTTDCNLTLTDNSGQSIVITVRPITGYVSVRYN